MVTTNQLANIGSMTINSLILYAVPLWSLTGSINISRIQTAQIKAAKQILWTKRKSFKMTEYRQDILDKVEWLNVVQLTQQATINLVRRATKGSVSEGIKKMFFIKKNETKRKVLQNFVHTE